MFSKELSDEENVAVIFRMSEAYQLMKLRKYQDALNRYEAIVINYPKSYLVGAAKAQIKLCKNIIAGKFTIPHPGEGDREHAMDK